MKKANVLQRKCMAFVCAFALIAALVCGVLYVRTTPVEASADDSADQAGRVLYYIDAGNLSATEDGTGSRADRSGTPKYPSKVKTTYMTNQDLDFGTKNSDGAVIGLYNSATDKLYGEDEATGKYWGLEAYNSWNEWCIELTQANQDPKDGFNTSRYVDNSMVATYKFEVDNVTTPLKITVGTRVASGWGDANDGNVDINDGTIESGIVGNQENKEYVFENVYGVLADGKPIVTMAFGTKGDTTFSWIKVETMSLNYTYPAFIKKGATTIAATPNYKSLQTENVALSVEQQNAINTADYFDTVNITETIGGQEYGADITVIPEHTEYFINLGGKSIGDILQAGAVYSDGAQHGETSATDSDTRHSGWENDEYYKSSLYGNPGTTLTYRINNVANGAYGVIVGTYGHWDVGGRTQTISANGGAGVQLVGVASAPKNATCYGDVTDGTLTVSVASKPAEETNDAYLATYILVYSVNKVSYDVNGGTGTFEGAYFEKGASATLTTTAPTYADHEFNGWFAAAEGGEAITSVTEGGTVYAQWTACEYANTWTWADDNSTASVTIACTHDGCDHSRTLNATVTPETVEATCTTGAGTKYTAVADDNGTEIKTDKLVSTGEANGHTSVEVEAVAATCTAPGKTAGTKCSVCNEVLTGCEEVPALAHTPAVDAAVAATCTAKGKTEGSHCSVCNTVITAQTETEMIAHNYSDGKCTVCEAADPGYTAPDNTGSGNQTGTGDSTGDKKDEGKKGGCGSVMGDGYAAFAAIALMLSAGLFLVKKTKKA